MPKFLITVSSTTYLQTTIEAADIEDAHAIARDIDGGDFEEIAGEASWNVENVKPIPEHRYECICH